MRRPLATLFVVVLSMAVPAATSRAGDAETWAQRLGFPADKRVVILYGNDMGALYEFNRPGQELLTSNGIQSVGVMTTGPWYHEFATWRRDNPRADVGVAISLTCPSDLVRWQPISPRRRVRSLVDADGYLWKNLHQIATQADRNDVQREIEAQIQLARASGLAPSHLMTHRGSLLIRPDLLSVYLNAAVKHWIPAVMVEMTPENVEQFRKKEMAVSEEVVQLIARYPLPKIDHARSLEDAPSYEATRSQFMKVIRDLPPGITQVFVSPADDSPGLRRVSPRWQNRVWETRVLHDPNVRDFLKSEGVLFTNWNEIMARFEERSGSTPRRPKEIE